MSSKNREQTGNGDDYTTSSQQQASRTAGQRTGVVKAGRVHGQESNVGTSSRRVFDKATSDDVDSEEMTSRERAQRLALLRSRNPYADINNPNNPNYKGRPGNKDIESYLAKRHLIREK